MFDRNFYPTPKHVISKMMADVSLSSRSRILEPSAGKGDILDYIKDTDSFTPYEYFCIEKNPDLQATLRGKGYRLIDTDFLTYQPDCTFDLIIMNPPFDNGIKHFLKAWEIAHNTEIRCLLPKVDLEEKSNERTLLQNIIKDNEGQVKDLGKCFVDAERKTRIEVCLISIRKEDTSEGFEFNTGYEKHYSKYTAQDINRNDVAYTDVFANLEARFNQLQDITKRMIQLKNEFEYYADGVVQANIFDLLHSNQGDRENYNNISDSLRAKAWENIFQTTKLYDVTTSNIKKKLQTTQEQQGSMAFTARNMELLFSDLYQNLGTIMKNCVVEAFDTLTKYHKENRCHIEGWKTNKRFYVNEKFILPHIVDTTWISIDNAIHLHYHRADEIDDIEKALCHMTGKKIGDIKRIREMFSNKEITRFGKWHDSEFFEFKCFKKGTGHFRFKDKSLWAKFNQIACEGKNWLGFET